MGVPRILVATVFPVLAYSCVFSRITTVLALLSKPITPPAVSFKRICELVFESSNVAYSNSQVKFTSGLKCSCSCASFSVVLSSDDEESGDVPQHCSPAAHTLVTVEDALIQGQSPLEALVKLHEASDIQVSRMCPCVIFDPYLFNATESHFRKDKECFCLMTKSCI